MSGGLRISWRRLEWWGCGLALFLQTGAAFPLLMDSLRGPSDPGNLTELRLLALPPYAITIALLARHRLQLLLALRRNLPLVLLLALLTASVLWSVAPGVSLRRAVALLLSMGLACVIAIRFTPRQMLVLVAAVLLPCMAASLCLGLLAPQLARMPDDMQLRGIFLHKNVLGWYSAVAVLVSGFMVLQGSVVRRPVAWAGLGVSLACLLSSTSMTGLLALLAVAVLAPFYALLPRLSGSARLLLVLVVLEAASLLMLGLQAYLVPALEALGKDATLTGRVPLWDLVDAAIARRPLLGFGYKAFWQSPEAWSIWGAIGWNAPHSHNGYREMLLSGGVAGLALMLVVLATALRRGAALHCADPRAGWIWLNVLVGMFVVMNLTECLFMEQNDFLSILCATAILSFGLRAAELGRAPALASDGLDLGPAAYPARSL
ncbi:O-antigen ligase family protein [Antarcticirhabdus aurantiaca]|uniref:O-antigen ligase family protein n=1 Tax=Antarcticirhabdus aurantiaca TaxID=2606717 RepID=A0ACD4NMV8_9HYPH|nr:O-antigen ligase family protein [Antarcticirhabdus aurantiaca]WAJ27946.1 O-antigen ligase family protein [Jeongeuplla avenae]